MECGGTGSNDIVDPSRRQDEGLASGAQEGSGLVAIEPCAVLKHRGRSFESRVFEVIGTGDSRDAEPVWGAEDITGYEPTR